MLPPQRTSHARSRWRRSHHALKAVVSGLCPETGAPKRHHCACTKSGYVRPGLKIKVPKLKIGVDAD